MLHGRENLLDFVEEMQDARMAHLKGITAVSNKTLICT